MAYIPLQSKISLINKYIQLNILRNKGEAMHVDMPENEIFNAIIEDLKAYNETPEDTSAITIAAVIDALKAYKGQQDEINFHMNALRHSLEKVQEHTDEQVSLDTIIKNLESL